MTEAYEWWLLTPGELRALQALADLGTKERAASALGIHYETERTHVKRAVAKLEARNATHAVTLAYRMGLIR